MEDEVLFGDIVEGEGEVVSEDEVLYGDEETESDDDVPLFDGE
jgi:hypothetical protein